MYTVQARESTAQRVVIRHRSLSVCKSGSSNDHSIYDRDHQLQSLQKILYGTTSHNTAGEMGSKYFASSLTALAGSRHAPHYAGCTRQWRYEHSARLALTLTAATVEAGCTPE
jgi:hypothetical protein